MKKIQDYVLKGKEIFVGLEIFKEPRGLHSQRAVGGAQPP